MNETEFVTAGNASVAYGGCCGEGNGVTITNVMVNKEFMLSLGNRIRRSRDLAGFTQEQLAEAIGVTRSLVAQYKYNDNSGIHVLFRGYTPVHAKSARRNTITQ